MDTVSISDSAAAGSDSGAEPARAAQEQATARSNGADASHPARESALVVQLDEDRLAWLALTLAPGLGPKRILDAVKQLKSASQIFTMPLTALEGLRFPAAAAQFLFDGKGRRVAEEEWGRVAALGATLVSYSCPEYPERLREIYDPPPVLWVRGDAKLLSRPAIAVVGTRHPTPYGTGMAEMLSRDLAARRLLIVSGMARGIDSCAHRGALTARMPHRCGVGNGNRRGLSEGEQEAGRRDPRDWRSHRERAAAGNLSRAAEFSQNATAF